MALPTSRDLTYSNGTPVNPDNLNNLQDQAIAAWGSGKHGDRVRKVAALGQVQHGDSDDGGVSTNNGSITIDHITGVTAYMGLEVYDGERIRSIAIVCNPGNSTGLTVRLRRIDAAGAVTTIASWTSAATGWQKLLSGTLDHLVVADSTYYLVFEVATTPSTIAGAHITYDRP